jgi:GSH-dependent disulfide-bond oxidoreductase
MIDLYSWPTPNGQKVHIALEELGLEYRVHAVNIGKGEQFAPEFLRISPNNRIPAIVDHAGPGGADGGPLMLFESGAILLYLAEKTGRLLAHTPAERYLTIQWLMFQMGGVGPMLGQAHHFRQYAPERIDYAIDRYTKEAGRLYNVLDKRLGEAEYLAGEYSIADIACWPWIRPYERQGQRLEDYPNLARWFKAIGERPAVIKGMDLLADRRAPQMDDAARRALFGDEQYKKR